MTLVLMTIMILFGSRGRIDYIGMHTHLCRVKVALMTIMASGHMRTNVNINMDNWLIVVKQK